MHTRRDPPSHANHPAPRAEDGNQSQDALIDGERLARWTDSAPPGAHTRPAHWLACGAVLGAAVLAGCALQRLPEARRAAAAAQPFTQWPAAPQRHLLVLGDSTGVGTGASQAIDSVAGRVGQAHPAWRIDNLAANGARAADLAGQWQRASGRPDLVLVMVGGNDVIRLTGWQALEADLDATVRAATAQGARVVLMPCGEVGRAPLFLPPLSWWLDRRSNTLHALVDRVAARHGARKVDLRTPRAQDPFVQAPARYHAPDGLHPSSDGYGLWYQRLVASGSLV